jgi:phosphoenolpyruvate carboxylase
MMIHCSLKYDENSRMSLSFFPLTAYMKKTLSLVIFGKLFMMNFLETKRLLLKIAGLREWKII